MANNVGNTPFWFGYSIDFWDSFGSKLLVAAVVAGIFAALASGVSSWISSAVTGRVQDIAGNRITVAEFNLQKSVEETARLGAVVAEANARAAEANRIAETERLARVKIEAALAGRKLNPDQVSKLIVALAAVRPRIQAINVTRLGDREASEFAMDIIRAVLAAGINVAVSDVGVMAPPVYGLLVTDTADGLLKAALTEADIGPATYADRSSATPSIFVGLKPPPF
jgi:hypothetical protein